MITKRIHYCWFGGKPLNNLGKKCLKSWKKYLPDYEIVEWNESNFDLNCCRYVQEAAKEKKWAFVSDYARYKILYEQGGIYFDTDVEVLKSFDDIFTSGAFMGCENPDLNSTYAVNPGLGVAVAPRLGFYKEVLEDYEKSSFYNDNGSLNLYTIGSAYDGFVEETWLKRFKEIQTVADITIYPAEYFCPINMKTGELVITENTHSIHRYAASWVDNKSRIRGKIYRFIARLFGENFANKIRKIFKRKK